MLSNTLGLLPLEAPIASYKSWLIALLGSAALAISAQLSVNMGPVPLTWQSTTVIVLGFLMGPRIAAMSVVFYVLEGILGLPVFANFSFGPQVLLGPTAGYILGFLPAAIIAGLMAKQGFTQSFSKTLLTGIIATSAIFLFGFFFLSLLTDRELAWSVGVMPFMLSESVKLIVLAWIFKYIQS